MNKAAKKTVSFILSVLFLFSVMPVSTAYASETGNTSLVSEGDADSRTIAAVTVSKMPNKTSYVEGLEQLDVTGGQIMVNYEDGLSEAIDMTLEMVTGFDNTCVGVQTLTVTYSGYTATFEVEIMQKSLQSIAVTTMPDKQTYVEGMDALDVTGGKVTAYYNNETSQVIDLTPEMVSGFDNTKPGPQCLTVTYQDKTTTFYVEIESDERSQLEVGEKALISISVSKEPYQTVYLKDVETLDVSGGKINLHYDDGSVEEIDMTPEMISGFDHTQTGRQTLTVTYGTQTTKFNVDICENNTTEFAGGIGTETYPYIIRAAEQLDHVRRYPAAHFELQSDIIFTEDSPDWKPIGYNAEEMFKGVFDGNGHTICNLGINATDDDAYYVGLFGIVWGGTIKNLGVLDSNISAATYDLDYAGSIAGYVSDGTIINCYNTGTVTSDDIVGGIVGYATGSSTIENCHNTGTIMSADEAGGIVGSLSDAGNISNCYNSGAIMSDDEAGGIAGSLSDAGSISNCYNAGTITSDNQAGGIAGSMQYGVAVTNCYNIGTVIGDSFSCGIVGYISGNGTITNCYYLDRLALGSYEGGETIRCTLEDMMSQNTFSGFDFEAVWTMGNEEYPLPVLQSSGIPTIPAEENASDFSDGQGTMFDPYIIETKEQLNRVRNHPWACFVLAENLAFDESDFAEGGAYYNEGAGWEPIGTVETPFYGVFDGNGHTIAGLQVDVADNSIAFAGLFGYVKNGQIKNLGLLDSQISATASNGDDSSAYAGGIAGRLVDDSLIAGCYNTDAVTATAFSDHCPSSYAGGIAGLVENDSIVTNCYNTGAVTANASSTADFITTASAGGIGGYVFDGTITTCYNTGEVKAKASAKYSYDARAYLGGIAGMISYSGSTEKCYYLDNVSAGVGFGSGDATRCTW